jgi:hypothetical protein
MTIRYRVELSAAERRQLSSIVSGGKHAARKIKRAQILLAADGGLSEAMIASAVSVGETTVYRTRRRFVQGNLDLALSAEARPGAGRAAGGHRLLQPAGRAQALDAGVAGRRDGQTDRACGSLT